MSSQFIEKEFAYEWRGDAKLIEDLSTLHGWKKATEEYALIDSIYDTDEQDLSELSTGVRARTKNGKTVITAKKFLRRGPSGEAVFDERNIDIADDKHPASIDTSDLDLALPELQLKKQLSFTNERTEIIFSSQQFGLVRIVNEKVTYSNVYGVHQEPLVEIEFEGVPEEIVNQVRQEVELKYDLNLIQEGKTDRAKRFLPIS